MWSKIVVILFFIWVSLNLTSTSVGKFFLKLLSVLVIKITLTLICSQCVCDLSIQTICEKHLPIRPVIYLVFSKCILIYTWTFFSFQLTSKYQVGSPRRLWIIKKILCLFSLIAYCLCKNKNVYFFIIFLFFFLQSGRTPSCTEWEVSPYVLTRNKYWQELCARENSYHMSGH